MKDKMAATMSADQNDRLDGLFHSLSDRTRRSILERLAEGPAVISELAEPFQMTFAAVAKHLRVLESADLITREASGKYRRCTLNAEPLLEADRWLGDYRRFWEENLGSLSDWVQQAGLQP